MKKILIVEDDYKESRLISEILDEEGYCTHTAPDVKEAEMVHEKENPHAIILDLKLPGKSGLEFLSDLRKRGDDTPVIMVSAYGEIEDAVKAIKIGAYDFIEKPLDSSRVIITLRNCLRDNGRKKELQFLKGLDDRLVGKSGVIEDLRKKIETVAREDIRILLTGPTGVGKNLVARLIHKKSHLNDKPFIHINCAALPGELIESELFGHKKGAFTGATRNKKGRFEEAEGGTLFLDEISEIPSSVQVKLLDFTETGEIQPVGGVKKKRVKTRIIAATNRKVPEAVEKGILREDLYYRLNVVHIDIPPVKEWKEDIPLLFSYFLKRLSEEDKNYVLTEDARNILLEYRWPGNVREIRNLAEKISVFSTGEKINGEILKLFITKEKDIIMDNEEIKDLSKARGEFEKKYIKKAIEKANGNITEASKMLGVNRSSLYKKINKYDIEY